MFIGGSKKAVVDNIARAAESGQFYNKVEVDDPDLTEEEKSALIEKFLKKYKTPAYAFSNWGARCITDTVSRIENQNTEYVGLEHIRNITTGASLTPWTTRWSGRLSKKWARSGCTSSVRKPTSP